MAYHGLKPRFISVRIKGDSGTGVLELANQTSPTLTSLAGHSQVFSYSGQTWQYSSDGRVQSFALSNGAFLKNYIARPTAAGFTDNADMTSNGWTIGAGTGTLTAVAKPNNTEVRANGGCFLITASSAQQGRYVSIPTISISDTSDCINEFNISFEYKVTSGSLTARQLAVIFSPSDSPDVLSSPGFLPATTIQTSGTFTSRIRGLALTAGLVHSILLKNMVSTGNFTILISNITLTPCHGIELSNTGALAENNQTGFVEWMGHAPFYQSVSTYYVLTGTTFTVSAAGRGRIKGKPVTWNGGGTTVAYNTAGVVVVDSEGLITFKPYDALFQPTRKATYDNFVDLYTNYIPLFEVWNTNGVGMVCKECHSYGYPAEVAADQFIRSGVLFTGSGGVIARYSGGQTIQMTGDDLLSDHGLTSKVASDLNQLTLTTVYKNNSNVGVAVAPSTALPAKYVNSGVLTNVTNNNYTVCAIYIIKDDLQTPSTSDPKIRAFLVPSTSQYANAVSAANSIGTTDIPNMTQFQLPNEFMMLEPVIAGFVIVMGDGSGNATIPALNTNGFSDGIRSFKAMSNTAYSAGAVNTADASSIKVDASGYSGALATTDTDQSLVNARVNGFGYIPAWASGQSYRIGNIVRRDNPASVGNLWRCTTANADVAWTVGNWELLSADSNVTNTQTYTGFLAAADTTQKLINDRVDGFGYVPAWIADKYYRIGNIVRRDNAASVGNLWRCVTANNDHTWTVGNWELLSADSNVTNTQTYTGFLAAADTTQKLINDRVDGFGYVPGWLTSKAYRVGNVVRVTTAPNEGIWVCTTAHTSGTFGTDISNWALISSLKAVDITVDASSYSGFLSSADTNQSLVNNRVNGFGYMPDWAPTTAYRVGNIVRVLVGSGAIYAGVWRCTTAHTSGGSFSATNWEKLLVDAGSIAESPHRLGGIDSTDTISASSTLNIDFAATETAIVIEYSCRDVTALITEIGRILLTTDGTNVAIGHHFASTASLNVTFAAAMNGSVIRLSVTNNTANQVRFNRKYSTWAV